MAAMGMRTLCFATTDATTMPGDDVGSDLAARPRLAH